MVGQTARSRRLAYYEEGNWVIALTIRALTVTHFLLCGYISLTIIFFLLKLFLTCTHMSRPGRPGEGAKAPGTGVVGGYDLPDMSAGNQPSLGPLLEQQLVLLRHLPSLLSCSCSDGKTDHAFHILKQDECLLLPNLYHVFYLIPFFSITSSNCFV